MPVQEATGNIHYPKEHRMKQKTGKRNLSRSEPKGLWQLILMTLFVMLLIFLLFYFFNRNAAY